MKYVGEIITDSRRDTRNEDVPTADSQVGISTEDFLRYINMAQEKCQAIAISGKSTRFNAVKEITLVSGTMQYTIPDRVYIDEHILNVDFSYSGLARDYCELRERTLSAQDDQPGNPNFYIRRGGSILLCPIYNSSGAKARVTYDRAVDTLDIRRGTVSARTIGATALTALTISGGDEALSDAQYLCINDALGNVLMYNIPITGYSTSTGVVTLSSFTFASGETCPVGAYVTIGQYTTTHCKLNHLCEKYMAQYAEYRIFRRDSSDDATEARSDMKETLQDLARSYQEAPRDEIDIQIDNPGLMVGEW